MLCSLIGHMIIQNKQQHGGLFYVHSFFPRVHLYCAQEMSNIDNLILTTCMHVYYYTISNCFCSLICVSRQSMGMGAVQESSSVDQGAHFGFELDVIVQERYLEYLFGVKVCSSKTALRIFNFSIVLGAAYLSYVKSIAHLTIWTFPFHQNSVKKVMILQF